MSNALSQALDKNATQISRLFYINLTVSLVVAYLCLDLAGLQFSPSSAAEAGDSKAYQNLESMDPLLSAASLIHRHGNSIRMYHEYLKPFISIESAATQAIVGVDAEDPAWLGLDADDRDRCRELYGSPAIINFDLITSEDPNTISIHYLVQDLGEDLLVQTELFSNESATKKLQACLRVARELGANIRVPKEWPKSFYFIDFLRRSGDYKELVDAVSQVVENWPEIQKAFSELDAICMANDSMMSCSPNEFRSRLERNALRVRDTTADEPTVKVTFLPTDVRTTLLLSASPIALMFGVFLGLSLDRRRLTLLEKLDDAKAANLVVRYPAVPGIDVPFSGQSALGKLANAVVWFYLVLGEALPLGAILSVFWWEISIANANFGWVVLTVVCVTLSLVGYIVLWKARLRKLLRNATKAETGSAKDQERENEDTAAYSDSAAEPEAGKDG